jgi:zinc protease
MIRLLSIVLINFVLGSALLLAQNTAPANTLDSIQMKYELYRLKNGLQVLLQPDSSVSEVSVEFWLNVGIRDEQPDKYGLAHFFEHVTPYGLRGKTKELDLFRSYRTDSNAQVKKDFIRYYVKVKPEGLDLALQYSAERLNAGRVEITDKNVESERTRVLAEIERNSKNPFWSAEGTLALHSATYGRTHPYGHGGYGTVENNKNFKPEDFRDWYEKYIHPDHVILFIVGNFDRQNARQAMEKYFGSLPGETKRKDKITLPPVNQERKDFTVETNTAEHYLALSWSVPAWGSSEDGALRILSDILDQRLKAKQIKEVAKTSATDLLEMYQYAGQFGIYASFSNLEEQEKIENFLKTEVRKLVESGITEEELNQAKQQEINKVQEKKKNLGFQESRTELLAESLLFRNNPDYYFIRLKAQNKLKKAAVEKTARMFLSKEPSKILFKSKNKSN